MRTEAASGIRSEKEHEGTVCGLYPFYYACGLLTVEKKLSLLYDIYSVC